MNRERFRMTLVNGLSPQEPVQKPIVAITGTQQLEVSADEEF